MARARHERSELLAYGWRRAAEAGPLAGARFLAEQGDRRGDPELAVEAAELALRARSIEADRLAERAVETAVKLLAGPADGAHGSGTSTFLPDDAPALRGRCGLVLATLRARHQRALVTREANERALAEFATVEHRGRQEVRAGATLAALGGAGLGLVIAGVVVDDDRKHKLAAIRGREEQYDLTSLDAQGRRADSLIGAGALTAAAGFVMGSLLLVVGARELRLARRGRRAATIRVASTGSGVAVVGRF